MVAKKPELCAFDDLVVHPALKGYFTYRFYKLALRLRAEVNSSLDKLDVIGPQLGLLRVLELEGPASQIALGRGLGIDKATMVKFLDHLEGAGLVQRVSVEGDRRVKHIRITPAGVKKLRDGTRVREEVEKRFFSPLTEKEREAMDRMLSKLIG
jgi:DNA-binding MarR family transcriptional regulator